MAAAVQQQRDEHQTAGSGNKSGGQGPAGADGPTPTLTIGTVTTGDPGTPASANGVESEE